MISISLISKSIEADTKKLIENISSNPDKEQELVDQFISETNRKIGRQHRNMFITLFTTLYGYDYETIVALCDFLHEYGVECVSDTLGSISSDSMGLSQIIYFPDLNGKLGDK